MNENKRITLEQLMKKAEIAKKDKYKTKLVYLDSIEGNIQLKKVDKLRYLKAMDEMAVEASGLDYDFEKISEMQCNFINMHCDEFKSEELQKVLGVNTPIEVIFEMIPEEEKIFLLDQIKSLYGDLKSNIRDEIKN